MNLKARLKKVEEAVHGKQQPRLVVIAPWLKNSMPDYVDPIPEPGDVVVNYDVPWLKDRGI